MSLLSLSTELVFQIAEELHESSLVSKLACTCRQLNQTLRGFTFQCNVQNEESSLVFWAAEHGNEDVLAILLDINAKAHMVNWNGDEDDDDHSPLTIAVKNDHTTIAIRLLDCNDTKPDWRGRNGRSALSFAVENNNGQFVGLLLARQEVDSNAEAGFKSPLSYACQKGYQGIVTQLLARNNTNVDAVDSEGSPLIFAVETRNMAFVRMLMANGRADPNICATRQSYGTGSSFDTNLIVFQATPISVAAKKGYTDILRQLLTDTRIDPEGFVVPNDIFASRSALSYAAEEGHLEVVKVLVGSPGVNTDQRSGDRRTPLSYAAAKGHAEVVEYLLASQGVNASATDNYRRTPLQWAVRCNNTPPSLPREQLALRVVKALISSGADPDSLDYRQISPIMHCVQHDLVVLARYLYATGRVQLRTQALRDWKSSEEGRTKQENA